jgi:peptidoglycan/xylan/chitin deacetylase (PgdA/CDA1 family)
MPRLAQSPENTLRVPPPQMSMQTQSVQGIAPQIGSTSEALASRDAIQIAALPRVQTPALTPRDTRVPQLSATPQNSSASRVARLPENAGRVTPNTEETRATGALSQPSAAEITARQNWGVLRAAQSEVRYGFFSGGDASQNLVALTFDDGPHPTGTTAILDVLRREKVPATFFVVGRNVEKHPEIVLRSLSEGHELANHSYHHLQGVPLSVAQWKDEIVRNNRAIQSVTGHDTRWFRAPGCRYSIEALQALAETGMLRADTTNNSGDWQQTDPEAIVQRVLSRLAPGQVLLFHDPAPQTARALPKLIHELRHRGYTFVTLTELARRAQQNNFQPEWCPPGQGIVIAAGPDFKPEPQPINAQAGGPPNALLQIGTTGTH